VKYNASWLIYAQELRELPREVKGAADSVRDQKKDRKRLTPK
jgi:hypothetical protein